MITTVKLYTETLICLLLEYQIFLPPHFPT